MNKAIIIGSSSGIGMQLAKIMSEDGFIIGLAARRLELLKKLRHQLTSHSFVKEMDIANVDEAIDTFDNLLSEMEGVNLVIVCAGIGHINHSLEWSLEYETIKTNVLGVSAIINAALNYFVQNKSGHLAVISSVAGLRGGFESPAYNASKSYISNYLEGVRCKVKKQKLDITITDIKLGLVDTAMAKGEGLFWVMPLEKAASQIYNALLNKKEEVYVTRRWRLIAFILKRIPKALYYKI